jgi:serine/threonine protein kinase
LTFIGATLDPEVMIVTDYASNGSLQDLLFTDKPFSWNQLVGFGIDVAKGMNYLHHKNILHRFVTQPPEPFKFNLAV